MAALSARQRRRLPLQKSDARPAWMRRYMQVGAAAAPGCRTGTKDSGGCVPGMCAWECNLRVFCILPILKLYQYQYRFNAPAAAR